MPSQDERTARRCWKPCERGNLFIVPLDDQREWYRYHHLFAEVLQTRLLEEQPDQVPSLHQRASEWYEHNGSAADAIRHALAAKDFERAATLIELAVPEMRRNRQGATVTELGWLKALPDELVHFRPVLSVAYAYALFGGGELEAVETRLRDAERWLDADRTARRRTTGRDGRRGRRGISTSSGYDRPSPCRAGTGPGRYARGRGNARRVLDLAPEHAHLMLGGAASIWGSPRGRAGISRPPAG